MTQLIESDRRDGGTGDDAAVRDAGVCDAGAALKTGRLGEEEKGSGGVMSFRARVYDVATGAFLLECRVCGASLAEAESRAVAKAALCLRGDPAAMDVRHLHECAMPARDERRAA